MPTTEESNERALKIITDILHKEIRLVAIAEDDDDDEKYWLWRVKPGNIERCAKLIVQQLYN